MTEKQTTGLAAFLRESLMIEGIYREPTESELEATEEFLKGALTAAGFAAGSDLAGTSGAGIARSCPEPDFCAWVPGRLWRPPMAEVTVSRGMLADVLVLVLLGAIPPKRSDSARENGL